MPQTNRRVPLALLLAGAMALAAGCEKKPAGGPPTPLPPPSDLLPNTSLPEVFEGKTVKLADCLGKGGLAVVFVDTLCPDSLAAVGGLPEVKSVLAKHGVPVVLINVDEPAEPVRHHYETKRSAFDTLLLDDANAMKETWEFEQIPCVYYFAPNGGLAYKGNAVWASLAAAANQSLNLPEGTIKFGAKGTKYG